MEKVYWYHGGRLEDGKPKGTYLYVSNARNHAKAHANEQNGNVYRLRPDYDFLVMKHPDRTGKDIGVIFKSDLLKYGGAMSVFEIDGE